MASLCKHYRLCAGSYFWGFQYIYFNEDCWKPLTELGRLALPLLLLGVRFLQRNWTTKGEIRKKGFKYATSKPPKMSRSRNPLPYCKFLQTMNVALRAGAAVESVQWSSFTRGPVFRFSHSVMGRNMFPTNPPASGALLLQSGLQASLLWRIAWGIFLMWWKPSFQNAGLSPYFHLLAQLRMSNKRPVRTSVCTHFTLATRVSLLWGQRSWKLNMAFDNLKVPFSHDQPRNELTRTARVWKEGCPLLWFLTELWRSRPCPEREAWNKSIHNWGGTDRQGKTEDTGKERIP